MTLGSTASADAAVGWSACLTASEAVLTTVSRTSWSFAAAAASATAVAAAASASAFLISS